MAVDNLTNEAKYYDDYVNKNANLSIRITRRRG